MLPRPLILLCVMLGMLIGVVSAMAGTEAYIESDDVALQKGRVIWLDNCETCHAYGVAEAPIPMRPKEWQHRVAKPTAVLYQHAIEGFIGEDYSMMPARGGNDDLEDEEVRLAVDYMVFLAKYYINQQSNQR